MSDTNCIISKFKYGIIKQKLIKPYPLSFVTLEEIETIWVYIEDDAGQKGLGEAVPLLGYGSENIKTIERMLAQFQQDFISKNLRSSYGRIIKFSRQAPFAVSAVISAMDFRHWGYDFSYLKPVNLVYPLSSEFDHKLIADQVENGLIKGYCHFKLKIGRNLKTDILYSKYLLQNYKDRCTFRFDANQAYNLEDAKLFCRSIEEYCGPALLWLEQPLPADDWQGMERLCSAVNFPLMLDESIYDETDVIRAKNIGSTAIKLKLFKHPGLDSCLRLAKFASSLGIQVTLGNGVSTDIGNLEEAMVVNQAPDIFTGALECNGFVKTFSNIAFPQLQLNEKGQLFWNGLPTVDLGFILEHLEQKSIIVRG